MGKLDTTITVSNAEYRPCFICVRGEPERKALFHRWEDKAETVPPSPLVCGPDGGVVRRRRAPRGKDYQGILQKPG